MNDIDISDDDDDDGVASLPRQTLGRIDKAFNRAIDESHPEEQRPRKRRRIEQGQACDAKVEPELAGGFLLDNDDNTEVTAGGFVVESDNEDEPASSSPASSSRTHIPLSLIPRALQLLDLDPSDQQVLSVFANAATSWSGPSRRPRRTLNASEDEDEDEDEDIDNDAEQLVSRRDWRAVCAALMPTDGLLGNEGEADETRPGSGSSSPLTDISEAEAGSSNHVQSADLEEESGSEDEYVPDTKLKGRRTQSHQQSSRGATAKSKGKAKSKPKKLRNTAEESVSEASTSGARSLTERQKQDTLAAFALFFPGLPKEDITETKLSSRKLTIRDVANAAATIKEKITAEEVRVFLSKYACGPFDDSSVADWYGCLDNRNALSLLDYIV